MAASSTTASSAALKLGEAARRIRELLKGGAQVEFTRHALDELAADKLTIMEVYDALAHCRVTRPAERDPVHANWKYTAEGMSDQRPIGAVVVIDAEPEGITVITVWEVKGQWR